MSGNALQKDVVGIGVEPVTPQLQRCICGLSAMIDDSWKARFALVWGETLVEAPDHPHRSQVVSALRQAEKHTSIRD